jgi:hypothetical protein
MMDFEKNLGYNACFVAITFALPNGGCFTMHMKEITMRVITCHVVIT